MKAKKFSGAEVYNQVSKAIDNPDMIITITGIGCSAQFGIEVKFKNSNLYLFMPFDKVVYLKDLTQEILTNTINEVKFYTNQIKIKHENNSELDSEIEELVDL